MITIMYVIYWRIFYKACSQKLLQRFIIKFHSLVSGIDIIFYALELDLIGIKGTPNAPFLISILLVRHFAHQMFFSDKHA